MKRGTDIRVKKKNMVEIKTYMGTAGTLGTVGRGMKPLWATETVRGKKYSLSLSVASTVEPGCPAHSPRHLGKPGK